jgi:transcriptional regulator with XRE-family HTH domain
MFFILHQNTDADELSARLAKNLRRLRIASRHSLSELARATEVSKATLSGIERGRGNPTVQTLAALARALHVAVPELLGEPAAGEVRIVRRARDQLMASDQVTVRELDRVRAQGPLEISELAIPSGCAHDVGGGPPGSRVYLVVLEGKLLAGPSERISELCSGDYCSFPAERPCVYEALGGTARALAITKSES